MSSSPVQSRRGAVGVMAAGCGITVGNVYMCQPLLPAMASTFHVTAGAAALVATGAQIGYAVGILFVIPVADRADPRKLIRILLGLTCLMLICAGLSPSVHVLALLTLLVATVTVIPQVLIPIAVSSAAEGQSGRVIGAMQTGLVLGILLCRAVSGAIAQFSGTWRASYFLSATLSGILFLVLPLYLPKRAHAAAASNVSYRSLLASLPRLFIKWGDLRLSAVLGATVFGAFSAFWATLAFHLALPPFNLGTAQAGLFGLYGAAGAVLAPLCGRLSDKYGSTTVNAISLVTAAIGFALFLVAGDVSMLAVVVGVNLLDFGVQSNQIANQARIFKLDPAARARLNTVYMVFTFSGGALGTTLGSWAWTTAGWRGVCCAGMGLLAVGTLFILMRCWPRPRIVEAR
ncbi:MFS transporter [Caballeronia sp. 15715]|uniref:MFS transporter n=1 Tax=Caballeronia sp. 15715 TaxID=3391030 RepID=UPI0039E3E28E